MASQDENLDDIIASLIDIDDEETTSSPAESELTGKPVTLTERAARQVEKIKQQEVNTQKGNHEKIT